MREASTFEDICLAFAIRIWRLLVLIVEFLLWFNLLTKP